MIDECWSVEMVPVGYVRQCSVLAGLEDSYRTFFYVFFPVRFYVLSPFSFGFSGDFGNFLTELFSLRIISIVYRWCRGLLTNGY